MAAMLESDVVPGRLSRGTLRGEATLDLDLEMLVYLPATADPEQGFPLILFLHGRGERTTLDAVASFGPPMLARTQPEFPWAVIAPRCPPERGWEVGELAVLLERAIEAFPVDRDRVVVTGLSMGGFGTWAMAMTHPELFAAAVPICGGAPVATPELIGEPQLAAIRRLPIRAFHGDADEVVDPAESVSIADALRRLGCDVSLTLYHDVGHDSWTRTYADPQLWEWLALQRRANPA